MSRVKRTARYLLAVAACCIAFSGGRAEACVVCFPFPRDTASDQVLRADVVALARENPDKPFSYIAVEVLKGNLGEPGIDLFVNSAARRKLASNPGHFVVVTFDGAKNEWQSAGYANPAYQGLVREILAQAPAWSRAGGAEKRARFFMPYLADPDNSLRELAYLEVGRASYDTIRRADPFVPAAQVHRFLANPRYIEWRALYILLLGVNANPEEKEMIRAAMERHARFNQTLNLGAWATALIEIDGDDAVEWLETVYLGAPERDPEIVLEVVKALSVQGSRERYGLRLRIAESYGVLIPNHPSLAGWAARDLTAWSDWRFADALAQLREGETTLDAATAFAIDMHVGQARSRVSN